MATTNAKTDTAVTLHGLDSLRDVICDQLRSGEWGSALLCCEEILALGVATAKDVFNYCRCLMFTEQYDHLLMFMEHHGLTNCHKLFQMWAARCLFAKRRYQEVAQLAQTPCTPDSMSLANVQTKDFDQYTKMINADGVIWLNVAKAYEEMDELAQAVDAYRQCLVKDPFCAQALLRLTEHFRQLNENITDILPCKAFAKPGTHCTTRNLGQWQVSDESTELLRTVYNATLLHTEDSALEDRFKPLKEDLQFKRIAAEDLYRRGYYREALTLTKEIVKRDDYYNLDSYALHLCLLTTLGLANELFDLAHRLVALAPDQAISWYAVACYYYCTRMYDVAKRFFHKCTYVNNRLCIAWIGYGHTFAAEQEHDQAMTCYCRAWKISSDCHVPVMYAGLEYSLTNNLKLAEKFLDEAVLLSPNDPQVCHEFGTLMFKQGMYDKARWYLDQALNVITKDTPLTLVAVIWEPLLNNLGHVYRKLKLYDQALKFHRDALVLKPDNASSFTAIAFVLMLQGQFWEAIECLHQSLSIQRDDVNTAGLLTKAMDALNSQLSPLDDEDQYSVPYLGSSVLELARAQTQTDSSSMCDITFNASSEMLSDRGEADMDF